MRPTRINPDEEQRRRRAAGVMTSREYQIRFAQVDTAPETEADERVLQIVAICRRLLPAQTKKASDAQVYRLHQSYMAGRF